MNTVQTGYAIAVVTLMLFAFLYPSIRDAFKVNEMDGETRLVAIGFLAFISLALASLIVTVVRELMK